MKQLLEIKKQKKKKTPSFSRADSHKKKKLGSKWRKPTGLQNKMRLRKKSYAPVVKVGYRNPKQVRNLTIDGRKIIKIKKISELESIKEKDVVIELSSTIGNKKKLLLLEKIKQNGLSVLNYKVEEKINEITSSLEQRKKLKEEKIKDKKEKEQKAKKKEEKTIEETVKKEESIDEEKKDAEKKEKDKLLTKKQ